MLTTLLIKSKKCWKDTNSILKEQRVYIEIM